MIPLIFPKVPLGFPQEHPLNTNITPCFFSNLNLLTIVLNETASLKTFSATP